MAQSPGMPTSLSRSKRKVLLVAGVFSAILGLLTVLSIETGDNFRLLRFVSIIGIALLVLAWCYFDSLERHQPLYPWLRIVILIFGVFALFIYLFKTRDLKQGVRSSGLALLSLLGLFAIVLSSTFVCAVILVD
jgi:hypothetical protein